MVSPHPSRTLDSHSFPSWLVHSKGQVDQKNKDSEMYVGLSLGSHAWVYSVGSVFSILIEPNTMDIYKSQTRETLRRLNRRL